MLDVCIVPVTDKKIMYHEDEYSISLYSSMNSILLPNKISVVPTGVEIKTPVGHKGVFELNPQLASLGIIYNTMRGFLDSSWRGGLELVCCNLSNIDIHLSTEIYLGKLYFICIQQLNIDLKLFNG